MERILISERPDYQKTLISSDFTLFNHEDGRVYWNEGVAYRFTPAEIEAIEKATEKIERMVMDAVEHVVYDEPALLSKLRIPAEFHDVVRASFRREDPCIYGRMDLCVRPDGIKLFEYNADTPTSLYESGVIQWNWLEDHIKSGNLPKDADQFNSLHDKLVGFFSEVKGNEMTFTGLLESVEDAMTIEYLAECAYQGGHDIRMLDISELAFDDAQKLFVSGGDDPIRSLFKLYPWEHMFREPLGVKLLDNRTKFYEPLWKSIVSNKGFMAILWKLFPNSPYILPTYFESEDRNMTKHPVWMEKGYVKKPLLSREGANVLIRSPTVKTETGGDYGDGDFVIQEACVLPEFSGNYALVGSWVVDHEPAGICIREDESPITKNTSRFVPHYIG